MNIANHKLVRHPQSPSIINDGSRVFKTKKMRYTFCIIFSRYIFFLSMLFLWHASYSQFDNKNTYSAPSPSSALHSVSTGANMYKGAINIGVDLHSLSGRGYSIPISLGYNGSGHKVQDVSSVVGLGWSISTNSLISRIVRGLPDEDPNGYFDGMGQTITTKMSTTVLNSIISNTADSEPDLFVFNIDGRTGSFVFDKDKNPYMIDKGELRILSCR